MDTSGRTEAVSIDRLKPAHIDLIFSSPLVRPSRARPPKPKDTKPKSTIIEEESGNLYFRYVKALLKTMNADIDHVMRCMINQQEIEYDTFTDISRIKCPICE
ncbi:hypothetical protein RF11_00979 [Thelohanellus kitauei]|uniref:Uncharacterized protein n=1 Tax=Thelohanellus kitauei TaxID=669202 RepID=A0A0C2MS48_THEKT|nr:hypothetical protein RF11_00979 [Thelohanellus kitauei]